MNQIYELILLALAVVIHEIGHYLVFKFYGYNPRIDFRWYGIAIGSNIGSELKLDHYVVSLWFGIFLGMIPLIPFFNDEVIWVIYFAMCSLDFISAYHSWIAADRYGFRSYLAQYYLDRYIYEQEQIIGTSQ